MNTDAVRKELEKVRTLIGQGKLFVKRPQQSPAEVVYSHELTMDLYEDVTNALAAASKPVWRDSEKELPKDDDWCWCASSNGRGGWWYDCLQFRFGTQTFPNSPQLPEYWMYCEPPENNHE